MRRSGEHLISNYANIWRGTRSGEAIQRAKCAQARVNHARTTGFVGAGHQTTMGMTLDFDLDQLPLRGVLLA